MIYKGESVQSKNIISKFEIMNDILINQYTPDPDIDQCPILIKKLFMYKDFNFVTQEFIPSLSYNCKGLVFYNLNGKYSDYIYIIPKDERIVCKSQDAADKEIKESHPHLMMKNNNSAMVLSNNNSNNFSNNNLNNNSNTNNSKTINIRDKDIKNKIGEDNVVLKVMKTDTSDIYHLYFLNSNKELTKYNYALIPNIKTSKYLFNLFNNMDNNENLSQNSKLGIAMECTFSERFKKWIPINLTNANVYQQKYVLEKVSELNKKYELQKIDSLF